MAEIPVRCSKCGLPLAGRSLEGQCAACLLESSLGPDPELVVDEAALDVDWLNRQGIEGPRPKVASRRFGEYELEGEVARGGMGIIYRARHLRLKRGVALKMILPGPLATPDFLQRFQNEARAAATLDHPNVVSIYDVGEIDGQPYYTMRLVEGPDLAREIQRIGPLPPRHAAELLAKAARAVHYAHQRGILHRDLKPANILLDAADQPHVTDFGLAKLVEEDAGLTLSTASLGTPSYMAPEQAAGHARDVTTSADVYSLGAILFEALTGQRPFAGPNALATIKMVLDKEARPASSVNRSVPPDLDTICLKCLAKEPGRRYATALELAEDLEHWLAGEPIRARRVRLTERAWLWCRRRPALAGLAGASLAALIVVSGVAAWRIQTARHRENLERYAANISLADGAIKAGSIDLAIGHLLECPEELRHWEWGRLAFECFQEVTTMPAHTNRPQFLARSLIDKFAFDDAGTHLATLGLDGNLAVWEAIEGVAIFRLGNSSNRVTSFAFRPRHGQIAVGKLDGSLDLLDRDSGHLISHMIEVQRDATNPPSDPVFAPNWDVHDQTPIRDPLTLRPWAINAIVWDRDGRRLLYSRADGGITVRDIGGDGSEWVVRSDTEDPTQSGWFTPDGSVVVVQSVEIARKLEAVSGQEQGHLSWNPASGEARGALVSPDGDRVVVIDLRGQATLWGASGVLADLGRLKWRSAGAPPAPFFSIDGSLFCTPGDAGTARVYRAATGEMLFELPDTVFGGAFSAEGDYLAVFGMDRIIHLWDVRHQTEMRPLRGHLSLVNGVSFSQDGQLIASASRDGVVKTWSTSAPGPILFGDALTWASGYSPDGQWFATAPCCRGIQLREAGTGRLEWKVATRTQKSHTMAFSPDSEVLYTVGSDRHVRAYRVADGRPAGLFRGHASPIWAVHCSADGNYLATGDCSGVVKVWDARTRAEKWSRKRHPGYVFSVFFHPNSRFLISAGSGRPLLWSVESGECLTELDDQGGGTFHATFSPDGRRVVAACLDHLIRVWEVPSGQLLSWPTQTQGTSYVSFSPDGLRFSVPSSDWNLLGVSLPRLEIWDATQGRSLLSLEGHRDGLYTACFGPRGRRLITSSMDTTVRQWESFPWRDAEYGASANGLQEDHIRAFAHRYWRDWLSRTAESSQRGSPTEDAPLAPGIPDWERDRWPERDPSAGTQQINLNRYYTGVLDTCFYATGNEQAYEDDLANVPVGLQDLGGIRFDVRGVIWLRPEDPHLDRHGRNMCHDYPERVEGIAIHRPFKKLHILHAGSTYRKVGRQALLNSDGSGHAVAAYVLHYADGTQHEKEVQYGRDLRNWWWGGLGDDEAEAKNAAMAWVGTNAFAERYEAKVRLFLSTFENPKPDVEVVSVDFVSKLTPVAPFLVAMTVEP